MAEAQITREAIAEHGQGAIGGMLPIRPTTTITLRRTWAQGGEFIATLAGHLPDGEVVKLSSGTYRLKLVGGAQQKAAA